MEWYWEPRSNSEWTPPQIATLLQGWNDPKGEMKSPVPQEAEVFVRELVQNFIDAARDERQTNPASGKPTLTFQFIELRGQEAQELSQKLNLESLSERYASFDQAFLKDMRLAKSGTVMGERNTIRLLVVSESNTCGMYGQWERSDLVFDSRGNRIVSRMRDALLASVRGNAGKGLGAFGEGKKAVIGISAPRALLAYTCFDPATSTDDVSRRFMGGVYWQNHIFGERKYSGFAMIGGAIPQGDVRPEPLTDVSADQAVVELAIPGLDVRDPHSGRGTTYVFIDHVTNPQEVAESIARNWWPIIADDGAIFTVIDEEGENVPINFSESLQPFIAAYQATESRRIDTWDTGEKDIVATQVEVLRAQSGRFELGELKLAINLTPGSGWSRREPDSNMSMVALIRDGMVVAYQHVPRRNKLAAPFVRGTFTVDSGKYPTSEDYLRSVEPPLHNKWQEDNRELDLDARKTAKDVYSQITERVRAFRTEYVANTPTAEQDLKIFRENLGVTGGKRVVTPSLNVGKANTPWAMLAEKAEVKDNLDGRRFAVASRTLQLAKAVLESQEVVVELGWEILEEDHWADASGLLLDLPIEPPLDWHALPGQPNVFSGTVSAAPVLFTWQSRPYEDLWTLRPFMKVKGRVLAELEVSGNE